MGQFLEQLLYDFRPVIYAALALISFMHRNASPLLLMSGITLAFCSVYIIKKRFFNAVEIVDIK